MAAILPYQQTVGQPGLGVTPDTRSPDYVAQGASNLASGLSTFSASMKERADKMDAAQSTLTLATLNNSLRDAHDKTAQGIQDGSIDPDKAYETFSAQAADLKAKAFEGLSPQQQNNIAGHVEATTGDLKRNLNVALFQRGQSDAAATIDDFGEQASRSAARIGAAAASEKFADFVTFAGLLAGLSPEKQAKLKQSFTENVHYNAFDAASVDALTKGDADQLAEIRRQLESPDGDVIDPHKRTALDHQIFGYEQHVRAQQAASANAVANAQIDRDNKAGDLYNQAFDLSTSGKQFSPDFIKTLTTASAGTSHQDEVTQLLSGQSIVSGFATKPAAERLALLNQFEKQEVTSGTNPQAAKTLVQLQALNSKLTSGAKDNIWTTAQGAGVIPDATAFDIKNPDSAFQVVQQRNASIGKVEAWAGTKVSPFQPQEIVQLTHAVEAMDAPHQAAYLGQLGRTIGDIDRINMVAASMDQTNKPLALALKMGTDQTTAGRTSSEFVLRGAQAVADKTVKRDDSTLTGWRADISDKVRGTLGDAQAEQDVIDAAYYTRIALDKQGIEAPGFGLTKSTDQAIKFVIGLPMERAGVKTLLPRTMDENDFDKGLKKYDAPTLTGIAPTFYLRGQPITPVQLANRLTGYGMRRDGGGNYIPTVGNQFITTDPAGQQPLRLNVQ